MDIPDMMRAAVLIGGIDKYQRSIDDLKIIKVPTPTPGPGEVLVKVYACGFCQTDYKAITGKRDLPITDDHIVGHEPAGVVAAVGKGVRRFKEGDSVAISPLKYCGKCVKCKRGLDSTEYCLESTVYGGDGPPRVENGAFAQYIKVDQKSVYKMTGGVSFEDAALTEPTAGSYKGLMRAHFKKGDKVVVVGVGGIGMIVAMLAKQMGADQVVAVDISKYALRQAKRLGIDHVVNPYQLLGKDSYGDEDLRTITDYIYDDVLGTWPDMVVEAAGPVPALKLTLDLAGQKAPFLQEPRLDSKGIRFSIFGITTDGVLPLDLAGFHFTGAEMSTSFNVNPHCMKKGMKAIEGGLHPANIVTHRYTLRSLRAAITKMGKPNRNKVMIFPNPDDYYPDN